MTEGIFDLFESVHTPHYSNAEGSQRIADRIDVHRFDYRPELEGVRVALFGVLDGRKSGDNEGCADGSKGIRECLYRLTPHGGWQATVDLGDLRPGLTEEDTAAAVESVTSELIQMGIIPIVIGGGQDLTVSLFKALEILGKPTQVVTIDSRLDFGADPDQVTSLNFMNEVILHEPNFLFDYTNLGHQGYLTDPDTLELLEKMQFDSVRLGKVNASVEQVEPILRDADLVSIDCGAIRGSDHSAHALAGPNGLSAAVSCQLARYAGMSDNLKVFGIFEHNASLDDRDRGGQLVGQILWHVLDGIFAQKSDYPKCSAEEYMRYTMSIDNVDQDVVFLKSSRSDRWWMEVPYPLKKGNQMHRTHLASCSYADYQMASTGEMPDRWWNTFQKLG
jgi:arginase family enzyme